MLKLLNSYWLIALGSLLIPLLIHLWNKKQPKRVKVGSLKWLSASVNTKSRSLLFQDWPLLLLRCLLLTFLVLFLVKPIWQLNTQNQPKKYAWVTPQLLQKKHLSLLQNTIDSLLAQEVELRYFNHQLKLISKEGWDSIKSGEINIEDSATHLNYWPLAQMINETFADATEHLIFTSNQLKKFAGNRPSLPAHIKWVPVSISETKTWVQAAYSSDENSVRVNIGNTSANGTTFKETTLTNPKTNQELNLPDNPGFTFTNDLRGSYILNNATKEKTTISTEPLSVGIFYSPDRKTDATFINKVILALSDFTHRPVKLELSTNSAKIKKITGVLFWLSDEAIPNRLTIKLPLGFTIIKDASGKNVSTATSWINLPGISGTIPLQQQVAISENRHNSVWQNNYAESVLYFVPQGKGGIYYFASRFNSQWNDLPASSFFPEIMSALLWPISPIKYEYRTLSPQDIMPKLVKSKAAKFVSIAPFKNLKYWCLLLATILFILERVWVSRKGKLVI